jgi:hypothetical protein
VDIKRVPNFTYLGSNVSEDGGAAKDIDIRMQKVRGAFSRLRRMWQSTFIHKDTKIKVFNVCVKSVSLYGCQTWLVTSCIQRKLQSFVNRCLHYILRVWWPRTVSSEKLWQDTGQFDTNMEIRKRKFGWIGHMLRKNDAEPSKAALQWNLQGIRKRGRPRNSWQRSTLSECGSRSWSELQFIAGDRRKWKDFIDNLCS